MKSFLKRLLKRISHQNHGKSSAFSTSGQTKTSTNQKNEAPLSQRATVGYLKKELANCSDIIYHDFSVAQTACTIIYINGMVDVRLLQDNVLNPLTSFPESADSKDLLKHLFDESALPVNKQKQISTPEDALTGVLDGQVLLIVDGSEKKLLIGLSSPVKRGIEKPDTETVIRGPREAFVESLDDNLVLLRKRLKLSTFKTEEMIIGTESKTKVVLVYIEGKNNDKLVKEMRYRLSSIEINSVFGSSYLEEFIEDNPMSPFSQLQYTERPDTVCASLLEGRVAVIVDGSPITIMAPVTLFMLMQSAEDYYTRFWYATWIRWVRFVFLLLSLLLPSFYIAVTTFHPEIIPEDLLLTVASAREVVPFPAVLEAVIMELFFEALREAAVRIPQAIGQAVSIIGALIIGTAAVQAGIASPVMVIIVSLTGISSFITPHYDLGLSFRMLRFPIMILAASFGLVGVAIAMLLIYIHLLELKSFGYPYLSPLAPMIRKDLKDTLVRAPWWAMGVRPIFKLTNSKAGRRLQGRKWDKPAEDKDE
ncbi:spore germination protein [Gorillibacterium massiliense]|uniref:spore germination protein n=1 Tax=Gorillibacterium massiliense TaxID=1280390 RepID=UPI000693B976|nr:spore germination protein [Gorillibacterium massiliense]